MNAENLQMVARRVVWFKKPEQALQETKLFLAHVMTYGTLSDISTTLQYFSEADFEAVIDDPPAGIFDLRSWTYWNVRFRREPVPVLPKRNLAP
ncbi:MAG TPA: hypothetical protein VMP68_13210 [Candidatus Eisenbacteria bacterium]|nr:hypothetical protein [Candidatus Eisenbacteria bacterium]